jgi:hypothetical protein
MFAVNQRTYIVAGSCLCIWVWELEVECKRYWRRCITLWTLLVVWNSNSLESTTLGNWMCLHLQVSGGRHLLYWLSPPPLPHIRATRHYIPQDGNFHVWTETVTADMCIFVTVCQSQRSWNWFCFRHCSAVEIPPHATVDWHRSSSGDDAGIERNGSKTANAQLMASTYAYSRPVCVDAFEYYRSVYA